jgi:hypothetical protein
VKVELKGFLPASRELAVGGDQELAFSLEPSETPAETTHDSPRPTHHPKKNHAAEEPAKL